MKTFITKRISSFTYLNATQFFGALNDNIYKFLIVYFLIQLQGVEKSEVILSATGFTFVVPFLLFSASSGTLADRFSKRNIIVLTKILELFTMGIGILAFFFESTWASYLVLFLLATQSAIFGPSKYGIVPELVSTDRITKANGLMTSFTFLAIILGTFLASFLLDMTNRDFILASIFCTFVSLVGVITSFCIEHTPPSGSHKRLNIHFIREIFSTLYIARQEPSLLAAVLGSSFFLFLGAFVQLNMIPYAMYSLNLTDVQGGYLFLLTALGIGSGSMLAGKISGRTVELGLVPFGGIGVTITCYLLDLFSSNLYAVIPLVVIVGLFGGIYQIPLDSYIQLASPKKIRGQVVAASNFLSFLGVLFASCLLYLISQVFGLPPDKGFTIVGFLTLGVTTIISFQFFDYLTRFIGMILSRIHFKITFFGVKNLPETPAVYICSHSAWNDTLLLLGAQRRRMRFFIEEEMDHSIWFKRLYHLLRVVTITSMEPLENNRACLDAIKATLKKGISVCIFINSSSLDEEIQRLTHSYSFVEILEQTHYPIVPVIIEKGEKEKQPRFFTRLLSKIRVPAEISFRAPIPGSLAALDRQPDWEEMCTQYEEDGLENPDLVEQPT